MDTSDQEYARGVLKQFLDDPDASTALLTGAAGTGKTYLVQGFLKTAHLTPKNTRIAAPTNKAVHVLRGKLDEEYHSVCQTIHRLLHAEEDYDDRGEVKMSFSMGIVEWAEVTLLIIDESSMLSRDVFDFLMANRPSLLKILFIGDLAQLPPVGEANSPAFTHQHKYHYDLHIIKRTNNTNIAFMYSLFRGWQGGDEDLQRLLMRSPQFKKYMADRTSFRKALRAGITSPDTFILAYSNEQVAFYNKMARGVLFPDVTNEWTEGERGLFTEIFVCDDTKFYTNDNFTLDSVLIEEALIEPPDFTQHVKRFPAGRYPPAVKVQRYTMYNEDGVEFWKIHESSQETFNVYQRGVRSHLVDYIRSERPESSITSKLWKTYHAWRKQHNAPIAYAYATTVHKSQGSTYKQAFIDAANIEQCTYYEKSLMKKCLYTAVTRASDTMLIHW